MDTANTNADAVKEDGQSVDPIDSIEDIQELKKIAKERGIAYSRVKTERDEAKTELEKSRENKDTHEPAYLSKEDFYKANEKQAKESLALSEDPIEREIAENIDSVLDFYKPRSGRETKESILKDLKTAHAAWRFENPAKEADAETKAKKELQGTAKAKAGSPTEVKNQPDTSKFSAPRGPESWYPKKEEE